MKFNGSMNANYIEEEEEENVYSTFLRGWLTISTFLGSWSNMFTSLQG